MRCCFVVYSAQLTSYCKSLLLRFYIRFLLPGSYFLTDECRLWTPYKNLHSVVNDAVVNGSTEAQGDLELTLRKHRSNFTSLLQNTVSLYFNLHQ